MRSTKGEPSVADTSSQWEGREELILKVLLVVFNVHVSDINYYKV